MDEQRAMQGTLMVRLAALAGLDVEEAFKSQYGALRRAALELTDRGVLVAAFDGSMLVAQALEPDGDGLPHLIVGRHPRCHLQLAGMASLALRHLFVRPAGPEVEVRDLRTGQGFSVHGVGTCGAIRTTGQLFVQVGGAVVFVLPRSTWLQGWPEGADEAWASLPPLRVSRQEEPRAHNEPGAPRPHPTWDGATRVTTLPALSELRQERPAVPTGEQAGVLTLESEHGKVVVPVTRAELAAGLLVGRYARCQLGAELSDVDSWSRVHVLLLEEDGELLAYDTASTPGTVIDAFFVDSGRLGERSVLALGPDVHLTWERRR